MVTYAVASLLASAMAVEALPADLSEQARLSETPAVAVVESGESGFTATVEFPEPEVRVVAAENDAGRVLVDMPGTTPDFGADALMLPGWVRLAAVPSGYQAQVRVVDIEEYEVALSPQVLRDFASRRALREMTPPPPVEVGPAGWMRNMRVAPVIIRPVRFEAATGRLMAASRIDFVFEFTPDRNSIEPAVDLERYSSMAFDELFGALVLNPGQLPFIPLGGKVVRRGSYLIITDQALASAAADFAEWKRRKGFEVVVAPIYRSGITTGEIKGYIQDAFDQWERPPEFILLLGDVNAPGIQIPAYRISNPKPGANEIDVTDQPYTYLRGDDYFPDAFIGRISTDSPSLNDARVALVRYIQYERDLQNMNVDPGAFRRATLFAGNFGEGGRPVVSPVETCAWLAERLRGFGWDVEEFYYRRAGDINTPDPIINSINRGVNAVAYRGWADANGPHYPPFYRSALDRLDNAPLLPVFTIFVCNTGDYGNSAVNPCFGEYSITRGTVRNPKAALAFFGPSDLHTSTAFNNPLLGGYYAGLMYENLRVLGALTQRSKLEVWRGFPHLRERGDANYVEFYYSVYNILGDPEVNLYFQEPAQLSVTHPDTLAVGSTLVSVTVRGRDGRPVQGALVTLRQGDFSASILTDMNGLALAPLEGLTAGTLQMTVIAHQAYPYLRDIPVVPAGKMIALEGIEVSNEFDRTLRVGVPVSLTAALRNVGTSAEQAVRAVLSSPQEEMEILDGEVEFGDIGPGQVSTAQTPFRVRLNPWNRYGSLIPFLLEIHTGDGERFSALARLPVNNAALVLEDFRIGGGVVNPGTEADLVLTVRNFGVLPVEGLYAEVHSHDNSVTFPDPRATFGTVAASAIASCAADPFRVAVRPGTRVGRMVELRLTFYDGDDRPMWSAVQVMPVGQVTVADPLGPDQYGYYAYEDIDDAERYPMKPTYEWVELDPTYGGQGADLHLIPDDTVLVMNLPFRFRFYGEDYDRITVCDNGWVSFGATWMSDFRNWGLPSPLGPASQVAVFWDDLTDLGQDRQRAPVRVFTRYDRDQGRVVVEWSRVLNRQGLEVAPQEETFELILLDPAVHLTPTGDGELVFQYHTVSNVDNENNYATVGIQDRLHRRGLEVSFSNLYPTTIDTLRDGRAIKITTVPPDDYLRARDKAAPSPDVFTLKAVYPNPFNSRLAVAWTQPVGTEVRLGLYDLAGREVKVLASGWHSAGGHHLAVDASQLPSGVFWLRLDAGGRKIVHKVVLTR